VEARSPDCRSNVENAPLGGRSPAVPGARFPYAARGFGGASRRPPRTDRQTDTHTHTHRHTDSRKM